MNHSFSVQQYFCYFLNPPICLCLQYQFCQSPQQAGRVKTLFCPCLPIQPKLCIEQQADKVTMFSLIIIEVYALAYLLTNTVAPENNNRRGKYHSMTGWVQMISEHTNNIVFYCLVVSKTVDQTFMDNCRYGECFLVPL